MLKGHQVCSPVRHCAECGSGVWYRRWGNDYGEEDETSLLQHAGLPFVPRGSMPLKSITPIHANFLTFYSRLYRVLIFPLFVRNMYTRFVPGDYDAFKL